MFNIQTKTFTHSRRKEEEEVRGEKFTGTKLAVVGLGYVGLPLAIAAAAKGCVVAGYDINEDRITELKQKKADFLGAEEQQLLREYPLHVSSRVDVLTGNEVFIICVPTPVNGDLTPDLTALVEASRDVGLALERGALVVVESTINPGICEELIIPILEYESNLTVERDFFFAYCPERVNPGDPRFSTKNIPRVIGATGEGSLERGLALYRSIIEAPIKPMASIKEAEAVKMVENAFRDVNIAFVNELALAFEKEGIDIVNTLEGAATKPFGFMPHYPGCGVGGHCIPVDPYYLIQYGKRFGFTHHLLIRARAINSHMPLHTVTLLRKALYSEDKSLQGMRIALLGLSYKKNIGDMRESPALVIRNELEREGAQVLAYDPYVSSASTVGSMDEALAGSDAAVIATDHDVFSALNPSDFLRHNVPIIIDGRNCLNFKEFEDSPISYCGIGRQASQSVKISRAMN